jgi:hypothetical protein
MAFVSTTVIEELRKRYYYVSHNFGGPEDLVDLISYIEDPLSTQERIHRLLSHPGYLAVVSPWKPFLNLEDPFEPDVAYTKPFTVYNSEGRFLYRVKEHNGIFGNSILDKALILQSQSGSIYYLQYEGTESFKTVLLLVNNLSLEPSLPITDRSYLEAPEPPSIEPSEYYIIMDASSVLGLSNTSINIHFLPTDALNVKTAEDILDNPITEVEPYILSQTDSTVMWFPQRSGWFTLTKGVEALTPLLLDDILGAGDDRLIYAGNNSYYIALGHEEDTNLIRQEIGLMTRRPPGFTLTDKIKLRARIVYG